MISEQVTAEIAQAQQHLREALAFAARTESPFAVNQLGEMIFNLTHIQDLDEVLNAIDDD